MIDATDKVLGRVLLARLKDWASENWILSNTQYGFRRGRGTTEQYLNSSLIINTHRRSLKSSIHLAFMDLSGAFDTVNRDKLWAMLEGMGVEKALVTLLPSHHSGTTVIVRYGRKGEKTHT